MTNNIQPPRFLFCLTCIFLFIVSGSVYLSRPQLPPSIPLSTKGQPTIGYAKAKVHVVVFEDPKCISCAGFNNEIFPSIKKEFLDTNKILYTVIPVSFMPGSMPAAIALLCVYHENPVYPNDELFFKYLDVIYRHQEKQATDWATPKKLIEFAQATSPAIQLNNLKEGIEKEAYRIQIEKNTAYGNEVMGGKIATPTVYVNGIKVSELTVDSLRKLITEVLKHEGIY